MEAKWTELPNARDARGARELIAGAQGRGAKELLTVRGWLVCRPAETYPIPGEGPRIDAMSLPRFVSMLLLDENNGGGA